MKHDIASSRRGNCVELKNDDAEEDFLTTESALKAQIQAHVNESEITD